MSRFALHILETPEELLAVEALQRLVWPGSETDVVPMHMLLAACHNGGLVIGAFEVADQTEDHGPVEEDLQAWNHPPAGPLVGFVFGFPGLYFTPDGPRPMHCSHMLGVHPDYRGRGLGYLLKRAQWQMVRHQGLDRIVWTYDPLLSRNAHLNIARLGAVCNTYIREAYGAMRDELNVGLPSDRFRVDWWVNSARVERRLSRRSRLPLDLAHFLSAGTPILNPTLLGDDGLAHPPPEDSLKGWEDLIQNPSRPALLMVEIPADFQAIKKANPDLALRWRLHTRQLFEALFACGYLVTDFVHLAGAYARSFYVLSHGESTF